MSHEPTVSLLLLHLLSLSLSLFLVVVDFVVVVAILLYKGYLGTNFCFFKLCFIRP